MADTHSAEGMLAQPKRSLSAWVRQALVEVVADPQFSDAHIARIYRVYRIAIPLYAVMTLATAYTRLHNDVLMAALWAVQTVTALGANTALLWRPKRAHRVMQAALALLALGMLARIPHAVGVSGLREVDVHALTVGILLALLVGQTLFAPRAARHVNLACVTLTAVIASVSLLQLDHLSFTQILHVVRLVAASCTLAALIGFVSDTVQEYGRLCEEHRLMRTLALSDPLTELANRRAVEACLAREIARARREETLLSVIMLDVDNFKSINDQLGHDGGDRALVAIAQLLREHLRASDEPARWAGDEFVVVLPVTGLEHAQLVAERLRVAIANAPLGDATGTVTLGVAQLVANEDDVQSLIARADRNLYLAKGKGRNCSVAA